jgi:hypothetical protein
MGTAPWGKGRKGWADKRGGEMGDGVREEGGRNHEF